MQRICRSTCPLGTGIPLGHFTTEALTKIRKSDQLTVSLELLGTEIHNEWSIWVYVRTEEQIDSGPEITVTSVLDDELLRKLADGERILFLVKEGVLEHSARGKFHPVFWSPVHFATENPCGIIVNPVHPALKHFPTREYAEYQWKDLLDHSVSLVIHNDLPFDPIVQVIPNFYHNRKLTNLTEYRVGKGKLLICGINIEDALEHRPAAAQLRKSLNEYMSTSAFAPGMSLEIGALRELLKKKELNTGSEAVQTPQGQELTLGRKASSDSVKDSTHEAHKGNDGIGHTLWLAEDDLPGHWWQVDLGKEQSLTGIRVKFHKDGNFLYVIHTSVNGIEWNVAVNQTGQISTDQTRVDRFNLNGRYVRIVYNGLPNGLNAGHYSFEVFGS